MSHSLFCVRSLAVLRRRKTVFFFRTLYPFLLYILSRRHKMFMITPPPPPSYLSQPPHPLSLALNCPISVSLKPHSAPSRPPIPSCCNTTKALGSRVTVGGGVFVPIRGDVDHRYGQEGSRVRFFVVPVFIDFANVIGCPPPPPYSLTMPSPGHPPPPSPLLPE